MSATRLEPWCQAGAVETWSHQAGAVEPPCWSQVEPWSHQVEPWSPRLERWKRVRGFAKLMMLKLMKEKEKEKEKYELMKEKTAAQLMQAADPRYLAQAAPSKALDPRFLALRPATRTLMPRHPSSTVAVVTMDGDPPAKRPPRPPSYPPPGFA